MHDLAWRIHQRRKMLSMGQSNLAAAAGITQGNVSHLENGRITNPTGYTMRQLADALHCRIDWLMNGEPGKAPAGFYAPFIQDEQV